MSDYQETALDFPNMTISGFKHEGARQPAMIKFSTYNDSVKIAAWTFAPGVPKSGYVGVRMSLHLFNAVMEAIKMATTGAWEPGKVVILENKTKPKDSHTPVVDSYIGVKKNEKTNAIHLIIQSADKNPANRTEARLLPGAYGRFYNGNGEELPIGEASALFARGWANGMQQVVASLVATARPQPKSGGGGNQGNGGYNRPQNNNGGGQTYDEPDF